MTEEREVVVRGGRFAMGDTRGDRHGWDVERPAHEVTLDYAFVMAAVPVTFEAYDHYCAACGMPRVDDLDPRVGYRTGRGAKPVYGITWFDAVRYGNWRSGRDGLPAAYDAGGALLDASGVPTTDPSGVAGWRLPTEAEWEYAARGGDSVNGDPRYAGGDDLEDVGWFWRNSGTRRLRGREAAWHPSKVLANHGMPREVALKAPNALGLYDLSGNVWEWCHDWFGLYAAGPLRNPVGPPVGAQRVLRGGSWLFHARVCRVAYRNHGSPGSPMLSPGFRLVRTVAG